MKWMWSEYMQVGLNENDTDAFSREVFGPQGHDKALTPRKARVANTRSWEVKRILLQQECVSLITPDKHLFEFDVVYLLRQLARIDTRTADLRLCELHDRG